MPLLIYLAVGILAGFTYGVIIHRVTDDEVFNSPLAILYMMILWVILVPLALLYSAAVLIKKIGDKL